jgi:hypothetical protein
MMADSYSWSCTDKADAVFARSATCSVAAKKADVDLDLLRADFVAEVGDDKSVAAGANFLS